MLSVKALFTRLKPQWSFTGDTLLAYQGNRRSVAAQRQAVDVERTGIPKYDPYTIE